jgi:hypothetical protein
MKRPSFGLRLERYVARRGYIRRLGVLSPSLNEHLRDGLVNGLRAESAGPIVEDRDDADLGYEHAAGMV